MNELRTDSKERTESDTPLHIAARSDNIEVVELLLNEGADVNNKNKNGVTPLAITAERGCLPMAELLLKRGADLFAEDEYGRTVLHFIALCEHWFVEDHDLGSILKDLYMPSDDFKSANDVGLRLETAELFLRKGANVDAQTKNGHTALHSAIRRGLDPMVNLLLRYNANVNIANNMGLTALHYSAQKGNKEITALLLEKGADVNAKMKKSLVSALNVAVARDYKEIVELLLRSGVLLKTRADYRCTQLFAFASSFGRPTSDVRTTLFKNAVDFNVELYRDGFAALRLAVGENNVDMVKWLLENGARVNRKIETHRTPLHNAEHPIIIEDLLKFGADIDAKLICTEEHSTALHLRAKDCNANAVAVLLEYGADINLKSRGIDTAFDLTFVGHSERGWTCAERTRDQLVRHQIKMQALDLHVERPRISVIGRYEKKLKDFRDSCEEEVKRIKGEFIEGTNATYYDILRKHARFLAKYMDNENIELALESEEYKEIFPLYASMIKGQYRKGLARSRLLKQASPVLRRLTDLPEDCIEKILDHLSYGNLVVLIECSKY